MLPSGKEGLSRISGRSVTERVQERVWGRERERWRGGYCGTASLPHWAAVRPSYPPHCERLLPCQINIDSLLSAFSFSWYAEKEDRFRPWIRQRAGLSSKEKKRGRERECEREREPNAGLYSFWRVIDQAQKHFHYSKLYLQFIKQPRCTQLTQNPGNPERLHLISIERIGKWHPYGNGSKILFRWVNIGSSSVRVMGGNWISTWRQMGYLNI